MHPSGCFFVLVSNTKNKLIGVFSSKLKITVMNVYRHLFLKKNSGHDISFRLIYVFSTIFAFQTLITAYIGSSYLEQFIDPKFVGIIFAVGAAGAMLVTLFLPKILRLIGNVVTILILLLIIMVSLVLIGLAITPYLTIGIFILLMAVKPQIYLNIDMFLETLIGDDEGVTGSKRGIILTLMSISSFFAPIAMIHIIGDSNNLANVYYVSAVICVVLIGIILAKFRSFEDPPYEEIKVKEVILSAFGDIDIRVVLYSQFLLQFFYTWAVIYIPLYLSTEMGMDWTTIGQIIAVGLFAFIIFQYPAGIIADKKYGEKEMMAIGFVLLALSMASIAFVGVLGVIGWMVLVFISRTGASLVEITTESYFFKHVKENDSNLISLFRLMRPLANLSGALIATVTLFFLPFNLIFVILGLFMVTGIIGTMKLHDTK